MKKLFKTLTFASLTTTLGVAAPLFSLSSCGNNTTSTTYTVTYGTTPSGLTWVNKPESIKAKTALTVSFSFSSGYSIDWDSSTITVNSNNIKSSCTLASTSLTIPANSVNGNVYIALATTHSTVDSVDVTYDSTPFGLAYSSYPSTTTTEQDFTLSFTLSSGYSLTDDSEITIDGGDNIWSSCTKTSTSVTIPSSLVTGNIYIKLVTDKTSGETITYSKADGTSSYISFAERGSASSADNLTINYTISDNKIIDPANCVVTVSTSTETTDITKYVSFSSGVVYVPKNYITGNLSIKLVTKDDDFNSSACSGCNIYTAKEYAEKYKTTVSSVSHVIVPTAVSETVTETVLLGNLSNTMVIIPKKGTYKITLNNCTLSNTNSTSISSEAPFIVDAKTANVTLTLNGTNTINDVRTEQTASYFDNDACVKAKCASFTIGGNGSLTINSSSNQGGYCKGLQVTKGGTLTIGENTTLNVYALDTAIQAAGAINITDNAVVNATSVYDDGIKTKFDEPTDDITYEGEIGSNYKRDITITSSAKVTVNSAANAINAAHNFNVPASTENSNPSITLKTSTSASGVKTAPVDEQNMYIAIPSTYCSYDDVEKYYFTVTFHDTTAAIDEDVVEYLTLKKIKAEEEQPGPGPRPNGTIYWYYQCDRPLKSYNEITIKKYEISSFGSTNPTPVAKSSKLTNNVGSSLNENDTIVVTSISGSTISTSGAFTTNYKKMTGQKASYDEKAGAKGIKAKNEINISNGTTTIESRDTGISAGYGDIFTKSATLGDVVFGTGNVEINNGASVAITSTEGDGIKANGEFTSSGDSTTITVSKSVEGLEAGVINITGGTVKVSASDDGLNASQVGKHYTDLVGVKVSGGILDVQTTSDQDTDAIDSNNTLSITGGLVIARVPGSGMSMALDWESGDVAISGATIVLLGANEKTPTGGEGYTVSGINTQGYHTVTYYTSKTSTAQYTFNNSQTMNSTTTVRSNFGKPTFNQ